MPETDAVARAAADLKRGVLALRKAKQGVTLASCVTPCCSVTNIGAPSRTRTYNPLIKRIASCVPWRAVSGCHVPDSVHLTPLSTPSGLCGFLVNLGGTRVYFRVYRKWPRRLAQTCGAHAALAPAGDRRASRRKWSQ